MWIKSYKFPTLDTERLMLRKLNYDDKDMIFNYLSNDEVTKYMNIDSLKESFEAEDIIDLTNSLYGKNEAIRWGIFSKESNAIIGACGYSRGLRKQDSVGEIFFELSKEFWGKGYMEEALEAIIQYGFEKLNLHRIEAYARLENIYSLCLLNRVGFRLEGVIREHVYYNGKYWDEFLVSLLIGEWKKV